MAIRYLVLVFYTFLFPSFNFVHAVEWSASPGINQHFIHAIRNSDERAVEHMLTEGVLLDYQDSEYSTPLCEAVALGNSKIANMLIAAGAAVNERCHGQTALIVAARKNHIGILHDLLQAGADVNAEAYLLDGSSVTPVLAALLKESPNSEVVKVLIIRGGTKNKVALLNALNVARRKKLREIEKILEVSVGKVEAFISRYKWNSLIKVRLGVLVAVVGLLVWPIFRLSRRFDYNTLKVHKQIFFLQLTLHLVFVLFMTIHRIGTGWPISVLLFGNLLLSYFFALVGIGGTVLSVLVTFFGSNDAPKNEPAPVS